MLLKYTILLLTISCFSCAQSKPEDECKALVNQLAEYQSEFVRCATQHSVPVQLCSACKERYIDMEDNYEILLSNKNCTKHYFDNDRINIIETTQNILKGLWTKAYCDDCYDDNHLDKFGKLKDAFETCLNKNKKLICEVCVVQYSDLNTFYKSLDTHNNGKVCYNMQDAMNRTRSHWSKELHCCQREVNLILFIIATSVFFAMPLIFYGSSYVITKRRERNHGLLNEQEPGLEQPTTSTLIAAAIIATPAPVAQSTPPASKINKLKEINESTTDESSDEDMLKTK